MFDKDEIDAWIRSGRVNSGKNVIASNSDEKVGGSI